MKMSWIGFGLLPVLMAGILFVACKRTPYAYNYTEPADEHRGGDGRPKLLFMTFVIRQNDTATTVELKEKNVVDGQLKTRPGDSEASDRLYVALLNKDKTEIYGYYLKHPLRKNVEYTGEGNELATKFVELNEAEFFIRTTLEAGSAFLRLDDVREGRVVNSFLFCIDDR